MSSRHVVSRIQYGGFEALLFHEESPEDPRTWDNVGTMACWHGRYKLGDVQPKESPSVYRSNLPKGSLILPLYLYDHSGITMNTTGFSCPWDSGQVGIIHVSPEKIKDEFGDAEDAISKAKKCLIGEVETYDQYLTGDVYEVVVKRGHEEVDSCSGFFGQDYAESEMERMLHAAACCAQQVIEAHRAIAD